MAGIRHKKGHKSVNIGPKRIRNTVIWVCIRFRFRVRVRVRFRVRFREVDILPIFSPFFKFSLTKSAFRA